MAKWRVRPGLLLCPQIPLPLHGLNPRTILGEAWWNTTRRAAYKAMDYHCAACGVPSRLAKARQALEGHEIYKYDYPRGRAYYRGAVALCNYCHSYIHRGRLKWLLDSGGITQGRYAAVIQHGDRVLGAAGLKRLPVYNGRSASWSDWRLILFRKHYKPLFKSYEEWKVHYADAKH